MPRISRRYVSCQYREVFNVFHCLYSMAQQSGGFPFPFPSPLLSQVQVWGQGLHALGAIFGGGHCCDVLFMITWLHALACSCPYYRGFLILRIRVSPLTRQSL